MITVNFKDEALTPENKVNHRDDILKLDIAVNEQDQILFMGLEWAEKNNVVVVYDSESKGWIRMNKKRYRVTKMGCSTIRGPFPKFVSIRGEK